MSDEIETKLEPSTATVLLDYYHCTFFLPLIGVSDKDFVPCEKTAWTYPSTTLAEARRTTDCDNTNDKECDSKVASIDEREAQAYRFFSPAIRDILFDLGNQHSAKKSSNYLDLQALKEWRIDKNQLTLWELHLGQAAEEPKKNNPLEYQVARFKSVTLYRYFNGIYLLAFCVYPKALDDIPNDNALYDGKSPGYLDAMVAKMPTYKALYEQLQIECWLRFTRLARTIYPSFPEQSDEKKIAPMRLYLDGGKKPAAIAFDKKQRVTILGQSGEDISPLVRCILKQFAKHPERVDPFFDQYQNIYDDRMFISVAYSIAGQKLADEKQQKLFYLALYGDRHADTWQEFAGNAYTKTALERMTQGSCFDLWAGLGGRFGFTGATNVYLYRGWFFREIIAPNHIRYIYDRMLIKALLYRASLRYYDNEISQSTEDLLQRENLQSIRTQRENFIRFTNRYWFRELTEQLQGKAIFKLQQDQLGLQQQYDIIKDELERTDEYLQANFAKKFTSWGLVIAGLALYYAALPLISPGFERQLWLWWCQLPAALRLTFDIYQIVLIPAVGLFGLLKLVKYWNAGLKPRLALILNPLKAWRSKIL